MKRDTIHTLLMVAAILLILIFGDADEDMRQHPTPTLYESESYLYYTLKDFCNRVNQ